MKVAIIGGGNGGQAFAGYLSMIGHSVHLYMRNRQTVEKLCQTNEIILRNKINGVGHIDKITDNLGDAVNGANVIMVVTTANAHKHLAEQLSVCLEDGQVIVLNPGRTCGAIEFRETLRRWNCTKKVLIAEAQSLVYACRIIEDGIVNIIGVKDKVMIASFSEPETKSVIELIKPLFDCFIPAQNTLETSLENIGAMFHPSVILFNAASIERGNKFYFYRDMTDAVAHFIEELDKERILLGKAYGLDIMSAKDWVSYAYSNIEGDSLCERMRNNPAYFDILAPNTINCRQISEDIPMGILPMIELGEIAGLEMPISRAILTMCSSLLNKDYISCGRTKDRIGLSHCKSVKDVLDIV